jgi:hypothetical protein
MIIVQRNDIALPGLKMSPARTGFLTPAWTGNVRMTGGKEEQRRTTDRQKRRDEQ